jgi:putative ABC transport system permease protein
VVTASRVAYFDLLGYGRSAQGSVPASNTLTCPDDISAGAALTARAAVADSATSLLLGLGAIALLVGGIGIANVMVISVLERRSEIGLRRALGATRRHVAAQFLTESLVLATLGGIIGILSGVGVTAAMAYVRHWSVLVPGTAIWGGVGVAIVLGTVAGLYPALRAARLSPTDSLRLP